MNDMVKMSDQRVTENPAPGPDAAAAQKTVCEDCGQVWIIECTNEDINLCLDKEKMEEIKKPALLLTILREETKPLDAVASLNSPARLTCIVLGPKDRFVYQWRVNHKGSGLPAYSGCKIDPVKHGHDLKKKDSQTSGYSDENITTFKPLNRKNKNIWIDKSDITDDIGSDTNDGFYDFRKEKNGTHIGFRTDNILETDNVETDTHTHSNIKNIMYCENILETIKSDIDDNGNDNICEESNITNRSHFGLNVDCAVNYKIEDVDIKEECIMEETKDFIEATNNCRDQLDVSATLQEANMGETKCLESQEGKIPNTNTVAAPVQIPRPTTGGRTIHQTAPIPFQHSYNQNIMQRPFNQSTMQLLSNQNIMRLPAGNNIQAIPQFTHTQVQQQKILQVLLPNGQVQNISLNASPYSMPTFINTSTPPGPAIATMGITTPAHTAMPAASMGITIPLTVPTATPATMGSTIPTHNYMPIAPMCITAPTHPTASTASVGHALTNGTTIDAATTNIPPINDKLIWQQQHQYQQQKQKMKLM